MNEHIWLKEIEKYKSERDNDFKVKFQNRSNYMNKKSNKYH